MRLLSEIWAALVAATVVGCGGSGATNDIPDAGSSDAMRDATADRTHVPDAASEVIADVTNVPEIVTNQCDSHTCPNGCCSPDGICIDPLTDQACGYGGDACQACATGDTCHGGACLRPQPNCGPSNCAGCCQGPDLCAPTGTSNEACGAGGQQCGQCVTSEGMGACVPQLDGGGVCGTYQTCHYPGCHGCCSGPAFCASGLSENQCGRDGENCRACPAGQQCAPVGTGGACVDAGACGPQNCNGCCQGDVCAFGDQNIACGTGGAVCANCAMYGWSCLAGTCN